MPSVKDLRTRWLALVVLLSLGTMVGCATLQGDSKQYASNNSLVVVTPQLDFGTVVVGRGKTLSTTILNRTAFGVRITDATVGSPEFHIVSPALPFSIKPGQSVSFQIQFTPQGAGSPSTAVAIASTAPQNSASLTLSGQAVVAGQITPSAPSISFGSVAVGQSSTRPEVFTNTGSTSVTVSQLSVSGADFQLGAVTLPFTVDPGQSKSFDVVYSPKAAGISSGSISVNSDVAMTVSAHSRFRNHDMQSDNMTISLSGTATGSPGTLTTGSSIMAFGVVQIGKNQKQTATITNSGGASVNISSVAVTGAGFTLSGITTPLSLPAGQSTTFSVTYAPTTSANASGTVTVTSNASGSPLIWTLSGSGVAAGALTANPSSLSFGTVQNNTNKSIQETLTNSGGTTVNISSIAATGAYSITGATLPITLAAGASTSFNVLFAPTTSGAANSSLTVTSDASNPSLAVPLTGTGAAPGSLLLALPLLALEVSL